MSKSILLGAALLFSSSALLALNTSSPGDAQAPPSQRAVGADQARGRALFVAQGCFQCHGYDGQGSIMSGPALTPLRRSQTAFQAYVRAPAGIMPIYSGKILPDADLASIYSYVAALPPPRAASAIPLLAEFLGERPRYAPAASAKVVPSSAGPDTRTVKTSMSSDAHGEGAQLFARNCASCHGAQMQGGYGPKLRGEAAKRTPAETLALLLDPPAGMPKLSPDPLSRDQMQAIASYVRSQE